MNKSLSPKLLGILLAMSAGQNLALAEDVTGVEPQRHSEEVAELIDAGYLKFDSKSGKIVVTKDLFEVLKDAGILREGSKENLSHTGSSDTAEGKCRASR